VQSALLAPLAALSVFWLWFLARGKSRGGTKRLALRATLLLITFGLVIAADRRGLFLRASLGFKLALLLALLTVVVGYLYLIRFCDACGRMERNFKTARCKRCQALLPLNGMSSKLRRDDNAEALPPRAARGPRRRNG
jgi:hypothetical protein